VTGDPAQSAVSGVYSDVPDIPENARSAIAELHAIGGDELVSAMMRTFVRFAEAQLQRLEDADSTGELATAATIAHTIKSSARQLGAFALGEACAAAELAGRGGDAAALHTAVAAMRREYAAARPWMDALAAH
jgi:HPt (histidine-containing phosphotransfer) domain-containing protein